jgi:hypothetical protein
MEVTIAIQIIRPLQLSETLSVSHKILKVLVVIGKKYLKSVS